MDKIKIVLIAFMTLSSAMVWAQRKVSELTLVYNAAISTGRKEPGLGDAFDGSTTTVYVKGTLSRSEMVSALASFTTIHDSRTGTSVILQEVSGQKILIRMTAENWKDKNKRYEGITFRNTDETKTISGYKCIKAIAQMQDGATFTVFYTDELLSENMEFNYQFKSLNGLPLEYEIKQGAVTIKYTVSSISMNPIPASKFDIPKSGHRELTYEESRQIGIGQ